MNDTTDSTPECAPNERLAELQRQVRDANRVLPVAARTKTGMSLGFGDDVDVLDTSGLQGIVAYEPSEFLISAMAGTPIATLQKALEEHGQYLPFDPMWEAAGATLGGTVASGISGPRQLLHGSLRDSVMEVQFVDGLGNLVRGGGKVVKNAAGFDLPKLMVGSYGRLGILTEVTLKVLPKPQAYVALEWRLGDVASCLRAADALRKQPLPVASVEIDLEGRLCCEFAGLASTLTSVTRRAAELVSGKCEETEPGSYFRPDRHDAGEGWLIRVAITPDTISQFLEDVRHHSACQAKSISVGGSLLWVEAHDSAAVGALDSVCTRYQASGVCVLAPTAKSGNLGKATRVLGNRDWTQMAHLVQKATSPAGKFLNYDR